MIERSTDHMTTQLDRSSQASLWKKVQAAYFFETLQVMQL